MAKVGGSLFDLPDLRGRLLRWAASIEADRILLVPGGGQAADVIRRLDRVHHLGETAAHWLALRMMQVNACFLAELLGVPVVESADAHADCRLVVLDACAFCQSASGGAAVEHSWRVTSDSIAAHVAALIGGPLVLLKSVDLPAGCTWVAAAAGAFVDEAFPEVAAAGAVNVSWVNVRETRFGQTG